MPLEMVDLEDLYSRDENLKKEDVAILQKWLRTQEHLPVLEEEQVAIFLHSCYYNIEEAKVTIEKYFTMKTRNPEIFSVINEENLRRTLSVGIVQILPNRTPDNCLVQLIKLLDIRPENFNFSTFVQVSNMSIILHLHQKGPADGFKVIFDHTGVSMAHLWRMNVSTLRLFSDYMQEGAPIRLKEVHLINVGSILDKLLSFVKVFLKKEIYNMIQSHASMNTLYRYVPQELLPEEFGGKAPSIQILNEENLNNLLNNVEFFRWHESQKIDESKRKAVPKSGFRFLGFRSS